jgi:putative peptidoglycan lipid II flippase
MRSTLAATLRAVLFLALPATVGLFVLRELLVELLFQRGAFGETSTQMVAWALAFFALGLPAHSVVEIVVRAFYAMHDTKTPVVVGMGAMVLNVVLSLVFIRVFEAAGWMALGGLALSNSVATIVEMVVLLLIIHRRLDGLEDRRMASSLARFGLASIAMGAVVGALAWLLQDANVWLAGGLAIVLGAVEYVAATVGLGAPEPWSIWDTFAARGRRVVGIWQ